MRGRADAAGGAPAVSGTGVRLAYGDHVAFDTSDFTMPAGAVTALIGPNGSGKSTLLSAVTGLVPSKAGRLEVFGRPPSLARRNVAYVLQATTASELLPVTVREVVTMGRFASAGLWRPLRTEDRSLVATQMERLEIADLADRHLWELSAGQRQRVLVAQGLVQQAKLLLLDEPVTGLDIVSRERILEAVQQERAAGRGVAMATHDLDDAGLADHVLLLAGAVVASGPPAQVLTAAHLSRAYGRRFLSLEGGAAVHDEHVHSDQVFPPLPHGHG